MKIIEALSKEKGIEKDVLFDVIETNLQVAYKNNFKKEENSHVVIDRETGEYHVYSVKEVVEESMDDISEITLEDAKLIDPKAKLGDTVEVEVDSKDFGRIAISSAKNGILQKLKEEERKSVYDKYIEKKGQLITGIVQRINGRTINISLDNADTILTDKEQAPGEHFRPHDRIKLYVVDVKNEKRGPRIIVSRTHAELVRKLFELEVSEIADGTVEIKGVAREAGSRSKISVYSHNEDVDAVGACVGVNGERVNAVVDELQNEKIDIVTWSNNPAILIENALSPSKVIDVLADPENKEATVIVPDSQLSLAIGKEGQNARLAAKLTEYKIDIKSESQAKEEGIQYVFDEEDFYDDEYYDGEYDDEYDEEYDMEYEDEYDEEEEYDAEYDDEVEEKEDDKKEDKEEKDEDDKEEE